MTKIIKKQPNSRDCFICGMKNVIGLKAKFYETNDNEVEVYFTPNDNYQGYPGRLHGGIASAILDEAIGRAIQIINPNVWGVTIDLSIKYRKPLPLNTELKAICRITKENRLMFEGTGEILTSDGKVAISASGRYMKLDVKNITEHDFTIDSEHWKVYSD